MEVFGYRRLIAYQKAKEIVKRTYKLLKKFPAEERYAMCDQLRRASVKLVCFRVYWTPTRRPKTNNYTLSTDYNRRQAESHLSLLKNGRGAKEEDEVKLYTINYKLIKLSIR